MAREPQKELQLSPGTAGSGRCGAVRCQPRDSAGRGDDAQHKPPQVRSRSWGQARPRNAGCPHRQPCPAHTLPLRPQPRRGTEGTTPGCSSLPTMWALDHLFRAEDAVNLDVGACPRVFFGEEGAARAKQGAGGRGVSREHSPVTAGKDPESYGPGEVNARHLPSPLKLSATCTPQLR